MLYFLPRTFFDYTSKLTMTLLVTGGAGFIGSNFLYYMREHHPAYRLLCLDALSYAGCLSTIEPLLADGSVTFLHGDIADRALLDGIFDRYHPDAVVHFAAQTHVDRSIADPAPFLHANIEGTAALLDACRAHGNTRFHHVSTDEVYGDLPYDRPDLAFTEDSPLRPSSPYSATKASSDLLVLAYARTYGSAVTISRCSNNYGPRQFPEKLIPLMISSALAGKPLPVYGEGKNVRDWLYVTDHCAAIDVILSRDVPGEIYNIGGHNERSNLDIVRAICRETGAPESLITSVPDRPGHDRRYAVATGKLERELGWAPTVTLTQGLRDTVAWYRESGEWLRAISTGAYLAENDVLLKKYAAK